MHSVDVIVPCYRYAHFLRQCVTSVLTQSSVRIRVLVIDDASPDETAQIASELVQADSRVTLVRHSTNRGHIQTYNEGIEWTSADYMLLLSADDYLLPGALGRAAALLGAREDVGFAFGKALMVSGDVVPPIAEPVGRPWTIWPGPEFVRRSGCRNIVSTPTAVVRTILQKRVGGYRVDLPHSGDMEMWLRLSAHGAVGMVNAYQAVNRKHTTNMTLTYAVHGWLPDLQQRQAALDVFFGGPGARLDPHGRLQMRFRRQLACEALGFASEVLNRGDAATSERLAGFAVGTYPGITRSWPWLKLAGKRRMGPRAWRLLQAYRSRGRTDVPPAPRHV